MCPAGIRPVRVLGRDADIVGQTVTTTLNQLYSNQMKYVLLEVEVSPGRIGTERKVATVNVSYANMGTKTTDKLQSTVSVVFVNSLEEVEKKTNSEVMVAAIQQIGMERNEAAMKLRDEGKTEEAVKVFYDNNADLIISAQKYQSTKLKEDAGFNSWSAENLEKKDWQKTRKIIKDTQYKTKTQQKGKLDLNKP